MITSVEKRYDYKNRFICYKVTLNNNEELSVPNNPENRHYQEIQAWIAAGNTVVDPNAE